MIIDFDRLAVFTDPENRLSPRAAEELRQIVRQVNLNTMLIGTGSPEGVVIAEPGQLYMDKNGFVRFALYVKQLGEGSTGWILA